MAEEIICKLIAVKRMIVSQAAKEVLTNIIKELKDDFDISRLEEENAQLKELLKSALSWLPDGSKLRGMRYAQLQCIKIKIAQVLGEE